MYLAILLIIVALLVFYNEYDNKMSITEYSLLFISLVAIIRASFYYIKFDTSKEGFTSNNSNNKNKEKIKPRKVEYEEDDEDTMILNSNESTEYLDSDEIQPKNNDSNSFINTNTSISTEDAKIENIKNKNSINQVNDLLGISNSFADIPIPTNYDNNNDEIKSIFSPKVVIGKGKGNSDNGNGNGNGFGSSGNSSTWNSVFINDGFGFNNTMNPVSNLWRDNQAYYNGGSSCNSGSGSGSTGSGGSSSGSGSGTGSSGSGTGSSGSGGSSCSNSVNNGISNEQWSQGMDAYNKGKWQRNQYTRPSDYVDYITPSGYGTTTPDSYTSNSTTPTIYGNTSSESLNPTQTTASTPNSNNETDKKCGPYKDLDETLTGDLIVKEYKRSKDWVAGYTYVPPIHWDVPQRHTPVCSTISPDVHKLTGLMDRGLPINALELTKDGRIADTEDEVKLSNVGSMAPKFNYQEQPFSKPYV